MADRPSQGDGSPSRRTPKQRRAVILILLLVGLAALGQLQLALLNTSNVTKHLMENPEAWNVAYHLLNASSSSNDRASDWNASQGYVVTEGKKPAAFAATVNATTTQGDNATATTKRHPSGKEPIVDILKAAELINITDDILATIPTAESLQELYGPLDEPVILGMDSCERYRQAVPRPRRYTAPAGLFNTGTNALAWQLEKNVDLATKWQVSWGKHRMAIHRLNHTAPGMERANKDDALPIVIVRDPFRWMQSMCKSPYATHWKKSKHCPNLVEESGNGTTPVAVKVHHDKKFILHWESMPHMYNDYYQQYLNASFPRLIIRFEDTILQLPKVLAKIAECAGTTTKSELRYQTKSAKGHGSGTDLLGAIVKTGDAEARTKGMTEDDVSFAVQNFDPVLLRLFRYSLPPTHNETS